MNSPAFTPVHPEIQSLEDLAERLDPDAARKVLTEIIVGLGSQKAWSGADMASDIAESITRSDLLANLPACNDQEREAHEFYARLADTRGWEHDYDPQDYGDPLVWDDEDED